MNWLSKNAEALVEICTTNTADAGAFKDATVDVAVVGSGYGGAVAALRFAEHGESVYVLERCYRRYQFDRTCRNFVTGKTS